MSDNHIWCWNCGSGDKGELALSAQTEKIEHAWLNQKSMSIQAQDDALLLTFKCPDCGKDIVEFSINPVDLFVFCEIVVSESPDGSFDDDNYRDDSYSFFGGGKSWFDLRE